MKWLLLSLALAACGNKKSVPVEPPAHDAGRLLPMSDAPAAIVLPPAPPLPPVPAGLPPLADPPSPEAVALGELLFWDPRLSSTGVTACASCHDPQHGFAGGRADTAGGKPNLRAASTLVNLAWKRQLGWDGRYDDLASYLPVHARGQLGDELATVLARIADVPLYKAHLARVPSLADALAAYVRTRYAGDAPWDRVERSPDVPADWKAGYQLFGGKAQCSVCHPPPLYTDLAFHRLGLIKTPDEGRGKVDPAQKGAFATPTLRGAAARASYFHDGSAHTLDEAIDWHLAGGTGQGADRSIIDPALKKVALTPAERSQLGAFVRALTAPDAVAVKPVLP